MNDIEDLELKIARFLRFGVVVAGLIMLSGWLLSGLHQDPFSSLQSYSHVELMDSLEVNFMGENWGVLLSYTGLAFLISLPVIRVLLTTTLFIKQKEFILALIAGLVLAGLSLSFSLGIEL